MILFAGICKSTFFYRAILHWLLEYGVNYNIQVQWQHFMVDYEQAIKGTLQSGMELTT